MSTCYFIILWCLPNLFNHSIDWLPRAFFLLYLHTFLANDVFYSFPPFFPELPVSLYFGIGKPFIRIKSGFIYQFAGIFLVTLSAHCSPFSLWFSFSSNSTAFGPLWMFFVALFLFAGESNLRFGNLFFCKLHERWRMLEWKYIPLMMNIGWLRAVSCLCMELINFFMRGMRNLWD